MHPKVSVLSQGERVFIETQLEGLFFRSQFRRNKSLRFREYFHVGQAAFHCSSQASALGPCKAYILIDIKLFFRD